MEIDQTVPDEYLSDEAVGSGAGVFNPVEYWHGLIADGYVRYVDAYYEIKARVESGVLAGEQEKSLFETYRANLLAWLDTQSFREIS